MRTFEEEREQDWQAYAHLEADLLQNHRGQYAAIAGGKLVKIAGTIEEARAAVKKRRHALVFQVGADPRIEPLRGWR